MDRTALEESVMWIQVDIDKHVIKLVLCNHKSDKRIKYEVLLKNFGIMIVILQIVAPQALPYL